MTKRWSVRFLESVQQGDFDKVRQYIAEGVDAFYCNGLGQNALHLLGARPGHVQMFDELVAAGCDIHCINSDGRNLFVVIGDLGPDICRRLIDAGLDVNQKDRRGMSPLHWAIGSSDCMRMLLEAGAEVGAANSRGVTPLLLAAYRGRAESFQLLLKHGADLVVRDDKGATLLHAASQKGSSDIVRLLIAQGANVNALDKVMKTPLHAAASRGKVDVCKLLVDAGAISSFRPPDPPRGYLTPFQEAVYGGHVSTVSFMHDYCGEQPYQKTPSGMRLMALTRNRPEMADFIGRLRNEIELRGVISAAHDGAVSPGRSGACGGPL
jgi:ankyrin repeat protein